MKTVEKFFSKRIDAIGFFIGLILLLISTFSFSQNPVPPSNAHSPHITPVYLLSIIPKDGGKSFTLFHKTKVMMTLSNQVVITGKVIAVGRDSIMIDGRNYAIKDIQELRFNPGSPLGAAAAIATTIGLIAIAFTIDKESSPSRDAVFYTGLGLAVVGGITLIPTYFVKKRFNSNEYNFSSVMISGN